MGSVDILMRIMTAYSQGSFTDVVHHQLYKDKVSPITLKISYVIIAFFLNVSHLNDHFKHITFLTESSDSKIDP